jgi:hypothetical protein
VALFLLIQEFCAIVWGGQHAGFKFPEEPVAIARDQAINAIAHWPRKNFSQPRDLPNSPKLFKQKKNGV